MPWRSSREGLRGRRAETEQNLFGLAEMVIMVLSGSAIATGLRGVTQVGPAHTL